MITDEDFVFIRKLIADHPDSSRRNLSLRLCEAWNGVQAKGALAAVELPRATGRRLLR